MDRVWFGDNLIKLPSYFSRCECEFREIVVCLSDWALLDFILNVLGLICAQN